jgi:GntR family transcriptional repressor for pyruvate dehydrogenase complex
VDDRQIPFAPARGRHAFEECVERLATAIRLGVYPHGSTLPPERELANLLGVSRATLREAIAALRSAKMVSTVRGRGGGTVVDHVPVVPREDPEVFVGRRAELLDSLVFRRVVEPGACHVAARRSLSAAQQDQLREALDRVSRATDPGEHRQADSRLHLAIAAVTDSELILESVTTVQKYLNDMLTAIPVLAVNIEHSTAQHTAIVDAILAGDAPLARRVMERHCDDTAALLRGLLR